MNFKLEGLDIEQEKSRKTWSKEEDECLLQMINLYGVGNWSSISQALKEQTGLLRTSKQCKNRWTNTLDPNVNKQDWTPEEEQKIYDLQKQIGNKWAEIAKHLNGRYFCQLFVYHHL